MAAQVLARGCNKNRGEAAAADENRMVVAATACPIHASRAAPAAAAASLQGGRRQLRLLGWGGFCLLWTCSWARRMQLRMWLLHQREQGNRKKEMS